MIHCLQLDLFFNFQSLYRGIWGLLLTPGAMVAPFNAVGRRGMVHGAEQFSREAASCGAADNQWLMWSGQFLL